MKQKAQNSSATRRTPYAPAQYHNPFKRRGNLPGGFSLIEVMVVVVIIALLAGVVGISVTGYVDKGRKTKAKADLAQIAGAVKSYYADHGKYPDPAEGIGVLVPQYLDPIGTDPWGGEYQYEFPGVDGPFDVICFGADGREGGEGSDADMTNWSINTPENSTQP